MELHHVLPASVQRRLYGRVVNLELVPLCGSGHNTCHTLLDLLLAGKPLPRGGNRYLRRLAERGYQLIREAEAQAATTNG